MAHQRSSSPSNQEAEPPSKGISWFTILLGIASILIILQTFGIFKTVDKSNTSSWVNVKSAEYENKPMPKHREEKVSADVNTVLSDIQSEFEAPIFTDIRTANEQKSWGLTDDEAKFYDDMRRRYGDTKDNWWGVVRRANSTYKIVNDIFGTSNVPTTLKDAHTSALVFQKLQQYFGISTLESLNFAQSGNAQRLSDWANFVEQMKK